jgi:hypothetical protein
MARRGVVNGQHTGAVTMNRNTIKRRVELVVTVLLPIIGLGFFLAEHYGLIDRLLGLDQVEHVAKRFDESYALGASRPVYPEDPEWKPTLRLLEEYSKAKWPAGLKPQTIARAQARLSEQDGGGYEWTSPATPIIVLFVRWPRNAGKPIPKPYWQFVGSIGQLHNWIEQSRNRFHFLFNDCFMTALAAVMSWWLWRLNVISRRE